MSIETKRHNDDYNDSIGYSENKKSKGNNNLDECKKKSMKKNLRHDNNTYNAYAIENFKNYNKVEWKMSI